MTPIVVLRSLAGMALAAVRRLQKPPVSDRSPSLTIGAVHMTTPTPEIPRIPREPVSRRSLGYEALLGLARELIIARFALTRALDKLPTEALLQVLDEVAETVDRQREGQIHGITTQRDDNR